MKTLFKLVVVLALVVGLVAAGAFFYVDSIARKAIEEGGEMALGVPTGVGDLHLSLFSGEAELKDLRIANPSGFSASTFFGLGHGAVAVSPLSLLDETITIPHVRLSGITINLEQDGKRNNVEPLLARAKSLSSGKPSGGNAQTEKAEKKFIVEYFSLEDVKVNADLKLLGQSSNVDLVLPKIELRNLGSAEQGMPMDELVQEVVQAVLAAVQSSSGQLSPMLAQLLAGELGDFDGISADVVGKAQAEVERQVEKAREQIGSQLDKVTQGLPVNEEVDKVVKEQGDKVLKELGGLLNKAKK